MQNQTERTYEWLSEAEAAIRNHFQARDEARALKVKRMVIKKQFINILPNGNMIWTYAHKGETVTLTQRTYDYQMIA